MKERKFYSAEEVKYVLENADLSDIDRKVINAKSDKQALSWSDIYNIVLQQKQFKVIDSKRFIR